MVVNLGFLGLGPHVKTLAKARDEATKGRIFPTEMGETETSPKKRRMGSWKSPFFFGM